MAYIPFLSFSVLVLCRPLLSWIITDSCNLFPYSCWCWYLFYESAVCHYPSRCFMIQFFYNLSDTTRNMFFLRVTLNSIKSFRQVYETHVPGLVDFLAVGLYILRLELIDFSWVPSSFTAWFVTLDTPVFSASAL